MKKQLVVLYGYLVLPAFALAQNGSGPPAVTNDSAVTYASKQYHPHSFLRRLFMGNNYRKEWEQEVKVPVFHFSTSGFKAKDLGGGMQTKSLHLVDAQGKEWALRTVEKYITKASVAPAMRNRLGLALSQDLISASFPYAAPLAGQLAQSAGMAAATSPIFFVADDAALGSYRDVFAGKLCTLEERDPGFDSTVNSTILYLNLRRSNAYKVQQNVYLTARLLDMLIADWDRHADNWRWGLKDSAGFFYYYAVDRDRDWAFYYSKGWIPTVTQLTGGMRCLIPFTAKLKNIKMLSWKAWKMDESYLNELDATAWIEVIRRFQTLLNDEAVEKAVKVLPSSIYDKDAADFVRKLKSRRDGLEKAALKYYRFLAENVVVNGSDSAERFSVSADGDGLRIVVYRKSDKNQKLYERRLAASETSTVTLNGFGGDDVFEVDENAKSKIRIKLVGGDGADTYDAKGDVRVTIYDAKESSIVTKNSKTKFVLQEDLPKPVAIR